MNKDEFDQIVSTLDWDTAVTMLANATADDQVDKEIAAAYISIALDPQGYGSDWETEWLANGDWTGNETIDEIRAELQEARENNT